MKPRNKRTSCKGCKAFMNGKCSLGHTVKIDNSKYQPEQYTEEDCKKPTTDKALNKILRKF